MDVFSKIQKLKKIFHWIIYGSLKLSGAKFNADISLVAETLVLRE